MDNAIAAAIVATTIDVQSLSKTARNQHGNYNFVSIDSYYLSVGKVAAQNGLSWVLREDQLEVLQGMGKSGAVRVTYAIDLLHKDGQSIRDFSRLTVLHPIQGAQTMGSAMSYGDKVWMRQAFKVQTGEDDADSTSNAALDPVQPRPKPVEVLAPPENVPQVEVPIEASGDTIWSTISTFIPECDTIETLKAFWRDNLEALDRLKTLSPDRFKQLTDQFATRRKELET